MADNSKTAMVVGGLALAGLVAWLVLKPKTATGTGTGADAGTADKGKLPEGYSKAFSDKPADKSDKPSEKSTADKAKEFAAKEAAAYSECTTKARKPDGTQDDVVFYTCLASKTLA